MLEQLIRPFESRRIAPTTRIVSSSKKQTVQTAHMTWGAAGTLPEAVADLVPDGSEGFKVKVAPSQHHVEQSRSTETKRVENPDDPDQFIMEKRVTRISFKSKSPVTGQTSTFDKRTGWVTTKTEGGSELLSEFVFAASGHVA